MRVDICLFLLRDISILYHLASSRQEPFIGVQPPNCVEAEADPESADTVQTKIPKYIPPTIEEEFEDNKARKAALKRKSYAKHFEDVSGDAPDGMQWAQGRCGDFMKKIEANEFQKESKEHPTLPPQTVKQIVKDHAAATADDQTGASGNISTSGGGVELGPLKMQAPNVNAGGQADKGTIEAVGNVAKVAALADRSLGGQIMHDKRYAPLSPNKGKMGEGVAGKAATADGLLDTVSGLAGPAAGILTGNPLTGALVGMTAKGTTEAMKGKEGDVMGGAMSGGLGGGIAGAGTGLLKALTDVSDTDKEEDACDKFMRKHTSEEEMLNDAIPKKSPAPEDLKEDKMLLTSTGCKPNTACKV